MAIKRNGKLPHVSYLELIVTCVLELFYIFTNLVALKMLKEAGYHYVQQKMIQEISFLLVTVETSFCGDLVTLGLNQHSIFFATTKLI